MFTYIIIALYYNMHNARVSVIVKNDDYLCGRSYVPCVANISERRLCPRYRTLAYLLIWLDKRQYNNNNNYLLLIFGFGPFPRSNALLSLLATRPDGDTSAAAVTAYRPRRRRRQRLRRDDRNDAHATARTDHRGGLVWCDDGRRLSVVRHNYYRLPILLCCVIVCHRVSAFVWLGIIIIDKARSVEGHVQDSDGGGGGVIGVRTSAWTRRRYTTRIGRLFQPKYRITTISRRRVYLYSRNCNI